MSNAILNLTVYRPAKDTWALESQLFSMHARYEDGQWALSPMKSSNNVNGVGKVTKHQVYTTDKEPALLAVQEALTRKLVQELNEYDNLYYEISNEPYFGGVTMEHSICMFVEGRSKKFSDTDLKHLIDTAGVASTIISSDLGLPGCPRPVEGFRQIVEMLLNLQVPEADIRRLVSANAAAMLNLE